MNARTIPFALLLALLAMPAAQAQQQEPPHRHVAVSGEGEVTVKPDRARLRLGVTRVNPDLLVAETEVNTTVRDYLTEVRTLGLREEDLNSTGVSINPEYVWDEPTRNNRLVGYRVSRDIEIVVLKLDQLGELVLRATKVGVNQVQAPQLEYSKAREIQNQALVMAALDAQARAKLLAETLGMRLGPAHQLNASENVPSPPMPKLMSMRAESADGGNQEMGLSAGVLRFGASVNAEFELILP
ncbi:MAG: SIMPL domain-containing protein [Panacagrimonas sp.]